MVMDMWNKFDLNLWNKHLTYDQNLNNGINLPEEDVPVIIHNYDNCKYYIGKFSKDVDGYLKVYSCETGNEFYCFYVEWQYFDIGE